jgi:hypothetical protein
MRTKLWSDPFQAALGSNSTWAIVGFREGKIKIEGGYV